MAKDDESPLVAIRPKADVEALTAFIINSAAAADIVIAAAAAGLKNRLYRLVLTAAGTTTIQFKRGATVMSGAMTLIAGTPFVLEFSGEPWVTTAVNETLVITNGAAVQISGIAYYGQKGV